MIPHTAPFHVGLVQDPATGVPFCSGALISPEYVLTTADCVDGKAKESFKVAIGEHDYNVTGDGESYVDVKDITVHPYYRSNDATDHNFALLTLAEPAVPPKHPFAGMACLNRNKSANFIGDDLTISDWGTGASNSSTVLKASKLNGISSHVCRDLLPDNELNHHEICAIGSIHHLCDRLKGGELFKVWSRLFGRPGARKFDF